MDDKTEEKNSNQSYYSDKYVIEKEIFTSASFVLSNLINVRDGIFNCEFCIRLKFISQIIIDENKFRSNKFIAAAGYMDIIFKIQSTLIVTSRIFKAIDTIKMVPMTYHQR